MFPGGIQREQWHETALRKVKIGYDNNIMPSIRCMFCSNNLSVTAFIVIII